MLNSFVKLVIGDPAEKRIYRQAHKELKKRVHALPKDYQFALRKMKRYMLTYGTDLSADLIDLFEASSAEGRDVLDVIGNDAARFCDELMRAAALNEDIEKKKLNRDIINKFNGEGK